MRWLSVCLAALILLARPGGPVAQQITAPGSHFQNIGGNLAGASGNASDLSEDILTNCNFIIPANSLPNINDVFQITLGGKFAATTDSKSMRVRLGTTNTSVPIIGTASGTAAAVTGWVMVIQFRKTAFNAQSVNVFSSVGNGSLNGTTSYVFSMVETIANPFTVTGQNTTNSAANSVTCTDMRMDYFAAR